MPENEFEKKISSELRGLKFKPSETVWMKVEERIRKKRNRRVFIIFFLFAGIALLGYWQRDNFFGDRNKIIVKTESPLHDTSNSAHVVDRNTKIENGTVEIKKVKTVSDNNRNEERIVGTTNISPDKSDKGVAGSTIISSTTTERIRPVSKADQKKTDSKNKKTRKTPGQKKEVTLTENDIVTITREDKENVKDSTEVKVPEINDVNSDLNQRENKPVENKVDPVMTDTLAKKEEIKKDSAAKKLDSILKVVPTDSPAVRRPNTSIDKKWKFGIEFIPGISSFNEHLFSFSMDKSANLNTSPGTVNSPVTAGPVKSNSGFAFQFGAYLKKQFTKRSSVSVGLRWAYYSAKLQLGTRVYATANSSSYTQALDRFGVNYAYRAGGYNSSYKENYHFIELPVNYQVQLNKSSAHPLTLDVGFKIGRLLTSNAITYDSAAGGIYYRSSEYLNKTQFGFTGGLSWNINKEDKYQLSLGPVLNVHLSSLVDNPLDKKKYLLFTGLRTTVIFNSKK